MALRLCDKDIEELTSSFTDQQLDALELREQLYIEQNFERSSHRIVVPGEMIHYRTELVVTFADKINEESGEMEKVPVGEEMKKVEITSVPLTENSSPHIKRWHAMANRIAEIRDSGDSKIVVPEVAPTKPIKAFALSPFKVPTQNGRHSASF